MNKMTLVHVTSEWRCWTLCPFLFHMDRPRSYKIKNLTVFIVSTSIRTCPPPQCQLFRILWCHVIHLHVKNLTLLQQWQYLQMNHTQKAATNQLKTVINSLDSYNPCSSGLWGFHSFTHSSVSSQRCLLLHLFYTGATSILTFVFTTTDFYASRG